MVFGKYPKTKGPTFLDTSLKSHLKRFRYCCQIIKFLLRGRVKYLGLYGMLLIKKEIAKVKLIVDLFNDITIKKIIKFHWFLPFNSL